MGLAAQYAEPPQFPDLEQWRRSKGDLPDPDLDAWRLKRSEVLVKCIADPAEMENFRRRCATDIVYWINMTAWAKAPWRPPGKQVIPLICWDFQAKVARYLAELILYCAHHDYAKFNVILEKARDMAGTVTVLLVFQWLWQFHGMSFIVGSRDKDSVDSKSNVDTPFGKLRFNIEKQPYALLPAGFNKNDREQYKTAHIGNDACGIITGEAPGENFGRKSRAIAALYDEFGFWSDNPAASWAACFETVRVRIAVSTPNGPNNKYAHLVHMEPDNPGEEAEERVLITLYWWLHPLKSRGLQWVAGKPTSPWYREQKAKGNKQTVAREVDLDYASSVHGHIFHMYFGQHRYRDIMPDETAILWRIWDPGDTSCVLFAQNDRYNRALFLYELVVQGYTITEIADMALEITSKWFGGLRVADIGDPQGWHNNTTNKIMKGDTEYARLKREKQINIQSDFFARIPTQLRTDQSIKVLIGKLEEDNRLTGTPGILVDEQNCRLLDRAFREKYRYAIDKNGQLIEQKNGQKEIDCPHPWEDPMDCARMFGIKHYYFGGNSPNNSGPSIGYKEVDYYGGRKRA